MPNTKGWPDPENPGFPVNPNHEGPHLIVDQYGRRRWFYWLPFATLWFSGSLQCHPFLAAERWTYIGPAMEPEGVTA